MKNLESLEGSRIVILASTGGHLTQSIKWTRRLKLDPRSTFVTFDTPQSQAMLKGRQRIFVPYIAPRDVRNMIRASIQLLKTDFSGYDAVLSTGAGIALAGLLVAKVRRIPFYYIESVSRFSGPSLTGKILSHVTRGSCFTQHRKYAGALWQPVGSLLGEYQALTGSAQSGENNTDRNLKVLVSLGTIKPYRFDRLVDSVAAVVKPGDSVVWQLGVTDRTDLRGEVHDQMNGDEFSARVSESDVVVTHAGVGTLLMLLDANKLPVAMPRLKDYGEHVDDHQEQVTEELESRGLVINGAAGITREQLLRAASSRIEAQ